MKDQAQTEEAQRIEINSQTTDESKNTGQKSCLHILHVDDDPCILDVSKQILSMENNFEVDIATSVDEALKKMEKQTYDTVVSDYEMPLRNGLDFLKELREQQNDVPFILFTGKGREEVVVNALNLGADRYINKQGSPETVYCELAHAINKTLERKRAREALVASESKYRTLVEKSLQGILVTKAAPLRLVFANEAMGKILGYSVKELLSLSPEGIMGLVYHEDRTVFFKRMETRLRGESAESPYEFRAVRKDGSIIWLSALANRVEYDGQPAVLGMFLNDDESAKAGEILRESEKRYRELANCLPEIVFETDMNGQLVFANDRAAEISGYSRRELEKGLNIMQFLAPEDIEKAAKNIQRLLSGGSYVPAEYTFVRKDGSTFPALITATLRISENKFAGLRGLVVDITERKKAEKALLESEERLRTIFEGASDGIIVADSKTKSFVFANPRICEITGYSLEELLKLKVSDIHPEQDLPSVMDQFTKQVQGKMTLAIDVPVVRKDRATVYCDISARPAKIGEQEYLIGFFRDITESKKVKDALRKSEAESRTLLASLPQKIFLKDKNLVYISCNENYAKDLKLKSSEIAGKTDFDFYTKELAEKYRADDRRIMESGKTEDLEEAYIKDGQKVFVQTVKTAVKAENGNVVGLLGIFWDITDRQKAEQAVSAGLKRFQSFIEVTGELGWTTNAAGEVDEDIPSFRNFTGQTYDEVKGCGWTKAVHPDDLEHATQAWQAAVAAKTNYEVEYRLRRRDGVYRNFMARGAPILEEDGRIREWVGTCIDITDRKKAEEALNRTMDEMVRVNEKIGVVGTLTRHDVRNKLCAVTANAFIIKKKHGDQPDIVDGLCKMEQAVKDVVKILDFAKAYEELGGEELIYVDVGKTLNESVALFSGSFNIEVINDCHGLTLLADSFLRQLFYNLIDNSLKHGEKVTRIRVHYEKADQDTLNLVYEDDGVGISAVNKPKLFKEGFSTGGSSGYGLYLIKKMIDVYGWAIQENGEPDKSARFTITIPRTNQKRKENFTIA